MDILNLTLINLTFLNISFLNETERTNKKNPENFLQQNLKYWKDKGQTNVSFNQEKSKPKWNQWKSRQNKTSQAEDVINFDVLKSKILSLFTNIFPNVTKLKSLISDKENNFLSKMIDENHPRQILQNFSDTSAILSVNRPLEKEWKGKLIEITIKLRFSVFLMASYVQHLMMNYFSVFYLDKLGVKTMMTSDKQLGYVFSSQKYLVNKTTAFSNPCQTYISYILFSSTGLLRSLKYYVNPILAFLGLLQNILCIAVLKKDGFSKTSNLNLLSVIVAGSFQQLLSINIAEILEFNSGVDMYEAVSAFACVKKRNLVMQLFNYIFLFLGTWGQYVFSSPFLLITIERFLAVFLPLQFKKYVTRKSMVSCLCIIFLMWLPFAVLKISCLYSLEIFLTKVSTQLQNLETSWLETCYNFSTSFALTILLVSKCIPLILALVGSVVIAIRIKVILNKRSKLTHLSHKLSWSKQTTKVLLSTCLLFSISDALQYILSYIAVYFIKVLDIGFFLHSELISFSFLLTSCNVFFVFILNNKRLLGHCKKYLQSVYNSQQTERSFT